MVTSLVFGLLLIGVSAVLVIFNWRSYAAARDCQPTGDSWRFAARRFRRQLTASLLIGVAGGMVIGGIWIDTGVLAAVYWSGVAVLVFVVAWLALAELASNRVLFRELRDRQRREEAALRGEIDRFRREQIVSGSSPRGDGL
jgi:heme exporter protein D